MVASLQIYDIRGKLEKSRRAKNLKPVKSCLIYAPKCISCSFFEQGIADHVMWMQQGRISILDKNGFSVDLQTSRKIRNSKLSSNLQSK